MDLRYMGFDQQLNSRAYKFEGMAKGEPTLHYIVTADMALFLQHRISLQEGPSLSALKLADDLGDPGQTSHQLTNDDLKAHVVEKAEASARKAATRRTGPKRPRPDGTPQSPGWSSGNFRQP